MSDEKIAEILVECGYADHATDDGLYVVWSDPDIDHLYEKIQYTQDTLEGRRQADAIEDWLLLEKNQLWNNSYTEANWVTDNGKLLNHQWRLDRIKWCIEQLGDKP